MPQAETPAANVGQTELSYMFEQGPQDWKVGFADLPVDPDQSIFELEYGVRALPDGLEGNGIYVQGHNRSDDLFMFLKREIHGLKPNATYTVIASIDLAANVPAGSMGIGGSPGDSVFMKAGASTVEPTTVEDDTAHLRMNIDKGNQANAGQDMLVLGDVANPDVVRDEYRLKTLRNADRPLKVDADSEDRMWLIVGTDSGFEGLTTLYYTRISYNLSAGEGW